MIYLWKVFTEFALKYPKMAKLIDITSILIIACMILVICVWLYDDSDDNRLKPS